MKKIEKEILDMNNLKKKTYRNTPAFMFMGSVGLISSSFTLAKVIRDNQEDEERYNQFFQPQDLDNQ